MNLNMITIATQTWLSTLEAPFHFNISQDVGRVCIEVDILDANKYVVDLLEERSVENLLNHINTYLPIGVALDIEVII